MFFYLFYYINSVQKQKPKKARRECNTRIEPQKCTWRKLKIHFNLITWNPGHKIHVMFSLKQKMIK